MADLQVKMSREYLSKAERLKHSCRSPGVGVDGRGLWVLCAGGRRGAGCRVQIDVADGVSLDSLVVRNARPGQSEVQQERQPSSSSVVVWLKSAVFWGC